MVIAAYTWMKRRVGLSKGHALDSDVHGPKTAKELLNYFVPRQLGSRASEIYNDSLRAYPQPILLKRQQHYHTTIMEL